MNDQLIRDLLHEVADDIEPRDRLGEIRSATAPAGRRTHRGWWAAGGAGLLAASIATAFALTGGAPQGGNADPAKQTTSTDGTVRVNREPVSAIYYVGDTPDGPRLFREFRDVLSEEQSDPLSAAVGAAAGDAGNGRPLAPRDPDYRTLWPPMTSASATLDPGGTEIVITLGGDVEGSLPGRGDLSPDEASLALEQLIRTAQGVVGRRLPVRFLLYGESADRVLGVPTSEPLTAAPDLDVLAHVSISDPFEGQVADNDEPFVVRGAASSPGGTVVTRIQRREGTTTISQKTFRLTAAADGLTPFTLRFDIANAPVGDYDVISQVRNADGTLTTDTRRITVVD
jgi:hypothetical protein